MTFLSGLHGDEHFDAVVNFLEGMTKRLMALTGRRIFEVPHHHLAGSWHPGGFFGRFITQGDDIVEWLPLTLIDSFTTQPRAVYPNMIESFQGA